MAPAMLILSFSTAPNQKQGCWIIVEKCELNFTSGSNIFCTFPTLPFQSVFFTIIKHTMGKGTIALQKLIDVCYTQSLYMHQSIKGHDCESSDMLAAV